jgi:putative restriction endonuclease
MERKTWTREEHLIAFNLYCRIPFGKIHRGNPEIIRVSEVLGRTPDALAMKMVNFARLDPFHQARGVGGLSHGSRGEEEIWQEFTKSPKEIAVASEAEFEKLLLPNEEEKFTLPSDPTEVERLVKNRLVQSFFRNAVLASYNFSCSFCELSMRQMLVASHIIPWKVNEERRADPRNGFCLCAFHDRAFDRGIISVGNDFTILLSAKSDIPTTNEMARAALIDLAGRPIRQADKFKADEAALEYHRQHIFVP